MLLPVVCPVCGHRGAAPCESCAAALRPPSRLPVIAGVSSWRALLVYDGTGRELVARLKYRNARDALPGLARAMATLVDARAVDVVTWAPTTTDRRRQRGFDQAELLARAVARVLRRPRRALLRRLPGPAQTGRGRSERRRGPQFVTPRSCDGLRVLVVDDVVTTGATLAAAARALRDAGALDVVGLAAAHTPRPR